MALGPQSRQKFLDTQLVMLEGVIDRAIRVSYSSGDIRVDTDCFPDKWVYEELKKKYLAAGWRRFEISSDQRDGTSINLYV